MLSRQVSSLVCPFHGSSTWAEMAVVPIKGFAAVVREVRGVLQNVRLEMSTRHVHKTFLCIMNFT